MRWISFCFNSGNDEKLKKKKKSLTHQYNLTYYFIYIISYSVYIEQNINVRRATLRIWSQAAPEVLTPLVKMN